MIAALILTSFINISVWLLAMLFKLKTTDCSAIAIEIVNKTIAYTFVLKTELSNDDGDFFDLLHIYVVIMIPPVLLSHLFLTEIQLDHLLSRKRLISK